MDNKESSDQDSVMSNNNQKIASSSSTSSSKINLLIENLSNKTNSKTSQKSQSAETAEQRAKDDSQSNFERSAAETLLEIKKNFNKIESRSNLSYDVDDDQDHEEIDELMDGCENESIETVRKQFDCDSNNVQLDQVCVVDDDGDNVTEEDDNLSLNHSSINQDECDDQNKNLGVEEDESEEAKLLKELQMENEQISNHDDDIINENNQHDLEGL
jgi:hypothetical protein